MIHMFWSKRFHLTRVDVNKDLDMDMVSMFGLTVVVTLETIAEILDGEKGFIIGMVDNFQVTGN